MKEQQTSVLPTQHDERRFTIDVNSAPELKEVFQNGLLDNLDKMETSRLNIASRYFDFQQGQPERFVFVGITEQALPEAGEVLPAIVLVNKEGDTFTNAGVLLTSAFIERDIPVGTPVEITWVGLKKTKAGNARTWRVLPLLNGQTDKQ